jgi:hypothetical protein
MCRKFKLIANIEDETIETLTAYFTRLARIYMIFLIVNAYTYFTSQLGETSALIYLILYAINCFAIGFPILKGCTVSFCIFLLLLHRFHFPFEVLSFLYIFILNAFLSLILYSISIFCLL